MESPGFLVDKCGNFPRRQQRFAIGQNDVATHAQRWSLQGQRDRVFIGWGARHQRGAGQNAFLVQFHYGAVHTEREPEIIRIHNQPPHRPSLSIPGAAAAEGVPLPARAVALVSFQKGEVALPLPVGG